MKNDKISSHPPYKKSIDEFINEASGSNRRDDNLSNKTPKFASYPWNDPIIRSDVHKVFTVKLPEELILKIKFISEQTNKSQQKIVREILIEEINKSINHLIK